MPRLLALPVLLIAALPALAQDVALDSAPARWRIVGERVDVGGGDDLGLLGLHYDVLEPLPQLPQLYAGLGGFTTIAGNRGGFFAGGVTVGFLQEISRGWFLDAGYFAGGGGGGGGAVNDGLLLRPHLGIEKTFRLYGLRLEVANVDLAGGPTDTHVAVGISLLSERLNAHRTRRSNLIPDAAVIGRRLRVTPSFLRIDPRRRERRSKPGASFDEKIDLMGIGLDYFLGRHFFLPLRTYGAVGGSADGFAMGLGGLGLSLPLLGDALRIEVLGLAGAAGGGDVSTGGGFLWNGQAALRARLWRGLDLEITGGYLDAPNGELRGVTYGGGLSWNTDVVSLHPSYPRSALKREGLSSKTTAIRHARLQVLHKIYAPHHSAKKKDGSDLDTLELVGVGFEIPVLKWLALTARAFGAYNGNIGGYAEGLFGAQYQLRPFHDPRHVFTLLAETGAGGGGGVDVGSGLLYEFTGGYRYDFTRRASFFVEGGRTQSDSGSFEAEVYVAGLSWDLGVPVLR